MKIYSPKTIEEKWQKKWENEELFKAKDYSDKEKKYILIEFPYPSGAGLHVGHVRSYTALDVISRKLRMDGYNVLYPIGWDAFGLPTENYAIKNKIHPRAATEQNICTFTKQIKSLGISFDWSREIDTTDPAYYKWTQWIFLKLLENGLAYKADIPINWCPACKIGLANEEVVNGKCERCGSDTEKRQKEQWMLAITKYADRLIDDLETVDYLEKIKTQQINWIGRSEGAEIEFRVILRSDGGETKNPELNTGSFGRSASLPQDDAAILKVFTTRPDTLFGCAYLVVSPEHPLISNFKSIRQAQDELQILNIDEVENYINEAKNKSELERTENKEKTGVEIKGIKAINPANNEEIPIFVADYVLSGYGTGAIMAVPAHDERDLEFAKKFGLVIRKVVIPESLTMHYHNSKSMAMGASNFSRIESDCFHGDGVSINSKFLNGLKTKEAKGKMIEWLEEKKAGKKEVQYKLRDWVFSRQRYWGEPIPIVYCEKCGTVPLEYEQLPLTLPEVENYEPTETGESPLANVHEWVETICPKCGGAAKRETDTMPNWAGSSWYFLRYADTKNNNAFADPKKLKYWMQVDLYNGGMEHTTLHLLYSRFWNKFLYDIGVVPYSEPYARRVSHGMILAEDGKKMSKSLGNVINPDDVVHEFGADALRVYEMFMGPYAESIPWSIDGLKGVRKFLEKVWKLQDRIKNYELRIKNKENVTHLSEENQKMKSLLHKTIKKVTEDIENFKFNTAISAMMILVNDMEKDSEIDAEDYRSLLLILSPFAPHMCEELWAFLHTPDSPLFAGTGASQKGNSIFMQKWPAYDSDLAKDEIVELVIQINGKVRDKFEAPADISEEDVKNLALEREKVKEWTKGKKILKVIFVKGKLVSIVLK